MATPHQYYELLPSYVTPESVRAEYDELLLKAEVRSSLYARNRRSRAACLLLLGHLAD